MLKLEHTCLSAAEFKGFSLGKALNEQAQSLGVNRLGSKSYRMEEWKLFLKAKNQLFKTLVDYCRHGPSAAKVENVEVNDEKYKGEFSEF